jgi:hypothetical protein
MRRFQVDVEYILNQIDPEAIAEYVSEDEQATESLLDMIESDKVLKHLIKNYNTDKLCQIVADEYPDNVLEMIVFSKIEQYYLANK